MRSHLLHMLLYSSIVSVFLGILLRHTQRDRIRFASVLWLVMVGGALGLAYLMLPFPG